MDAHACGLGDIIFKGRTSSYLSVFTPGRCMGSGDPRLLKRRTWSCTVRRYPFKSVLNSGGPGMHNYFFEHESRTAWIVLTGVRPQDSAHPFPCRHHAAPLGLEYKGKPDYKPARGLAQGWRAAYPCGCCLRINAGEGGREAPPAGLGAAGQCVLQAIPGVTFHTGVVTSMVWCGRASWLSPDPTEAEALRHAAKAFNIYRTSGPCW